MQKGQGLAQVGSAGRRQSGKINLRTWKNNIAGAFSQHLALVDYLLILISITSEAWGDV